MRVRPGRAAPVDHPRRIARHGPGGTARTRRPCPRAAGRARPASRSPPDAPPRPAAAAATGPASRRGRAGRARVSRGGLKARQARRPRRSITRPRFSPRARAAKFSAMRWISTGRASARTSSAPRRQPPVQQRPRPHRQHQRLRRARPRAPAQHIGQRRALRLARAAGAHQVEDRLDHLLAHRHPAEHAPAPRSVPRR